MRINKCYVLLAITKCLVLNGKLNVINKSNDLNSNDFVINELDVKAKRTLDVPIWHLILPFGKAKYYLEWQFIS